MLWNIEGIVSKGKYYYAVVPDHPAAIRHGYVLHHRVVMECYLGRLLEADEVVHHVNEDAKNNHPSNLALMTREEHARWHTLARGQLRVRLVCPWCQEKFTRRRNKTHLINGGRVTSCSRSCGNTFAWWYRRNPTDPELLRRMENNVEEEYDSRTEAQPPTPITELQTSALSPEELKELLEYKRVYYRNNRRHNKKPELRKCIGCGTKFEVKHKTATYCSNKCRGKSNRKTKRPSKEKLQRLVWKYPTTKIAERLGVSDSAVGKWCRQYGIDKPPRGYWAKQRLRK